METRDLPLERILSRREAIGMLGATGFVLLTGCGGGGSDSSGTGNSTTGTTTSGTGTTAATTSSTGTTTTSSTGTTAACAVTPEGEIGPYFADDSLAAFNRSNVLTNIDGTGTQTGVPLTLRVYVYDSENNCAALAGAQVDIWHCNASGVYSDEANQNTAGQTWLRGYQLTDATGLATFLTIIPGWYQGRTTHIHVRVRSSYSEASSTSDGANTTQVFFPQTLINTLATSVAPYSTEGANSLTNTSDRVYKTQTHAEMELTLTGSVAAGYVGTAAIHLPITSG